MSHYRDVKAAGTVDETVKGYYDVRNADVVQAMDRLGYYNGGICDNSIKPVSDYEVRGRALTARMLPTNKRKSTDRSPIEVWQEDFGRVLHDWLDITEPGDVICVDMGGADCMVGGDHLSLKSLLRGAMGMVVDGGIRDSFGVREVGFPVWSRYVTQREAVYELELEAVDVPVEIGGVRVDPGDVVCCDPDGVVVVPQHDEDEVLDLASEDYETDVNLRKGKVDMLQRQGVDIDVDFRPVSQRTEVPVNLEGVDDDVWEEVLAALEEDY